MFQVDLNASSDLGGGDTTQPDDNVVIKEGGAHQVVELQEVSYSTSTLNCQYFNVLYFRRLNTKVTPTPPPTKSCSFRK